MKRKTALPSIDPLDKRLNAFRPDLADIRLRKKVVADRFSAGKPGQIRAPVVDLKISPDAQSETCHQLLLGETVVVFEHGNDWAWVQAKRDFYVGYIQSEALDMSGSDDGEKIPTDIVCVPSTFLYPQAELKRPPLMALSMGSLVSVQKYQLVRNTKYAILENGSALIAGHICPCDAPEKDYVSVCERLENVPYLWGGASGFGVDCAGLVQLAQRMSGQNVLRDSDMQGASLGEEIDGGPDMKNLRRGDLVFWRGHVGVCQGDIAGVPHIIHASGHTMNVVSEPLHEAIRRIADLYQRQIGFKRCS